MRIDYVEMLYLLVFVVFIMMINDGNETVSWRIDSLTGNGVTRAGSIATCVPEVDGSARRFPTHSRHVFLFFVIPQ